MKRFLSFFAKLDENTAGWPAATGILIMVGLHHILTKELPYSANTLLLKCGLTQTTIVWTGVLIIALTLILWLLGYRRHARIFTIIFAALFTIQFILSVFGLIMSIPTLVKTPNYKGFMELKVGAILWLVNIILFAVWYWLLDGSGSTARAADKNYRRDILFPEHGSDQHAPNWSPSFIDYLFFSFNTATNFGPSGADCVNRSFKILCVLQAVISIAITCVLAAHAVGVIP